MRRSYKPLGAENHPSSHACSADTTLCSDEEVCRWMFMENSCRPALSVHVAGAEFTHAFFLVPLHSDVAKKMYPVRCLIIFILTADCLIHPGCLHRAGLEACVFNGSNLGRGPMQTFFMELFS